MAMFKIGDSVVAFIGQYEGYPSVSRYNIPRGPLTVVGGGSECGYINLDIGNGYVSPPLNPEAFRSVTPTAPVREVTTRRVIPGTYGKVRVTEGGYVHCKSMKTAEEIRDTIATLEQIAEALDEAD